MIETMARRVAKEFRNGDLVNLGIGMPTQVSNYIPAGIELILQSENGMLKMGPTPKEGEANPRITVSMLPYPHSIRDHIHYRSKREKEIITDGKDGILVKPSDPEALAAAIRNLASDRSLREKMGDEAFHTFAQRFSYDIFFSKIMDIYKAVENS